MKVTCKKGSEMVAQFQQQETIGAAASNIRGLVGSGVEAMDLSTPSPVERTVIKTPGMARK